MRYLGTPGWARLSRASGLTSVALAAAAFGVAGCVEHTPQRPIPLFAIRGKQPGPERLAYLQGDVSEVDGREVDNESGRGFTLLPGCHVITPASEMRAYGPQQGQVDPWLVAVASGPKLQYAITMQAGAHYVVHVQTVSSSTSPTLRTEVYRQGAQGKRVEVFQPTTDQSALDRCVAGG